MPHKRPKRTIREKLRNQQGTDLAPGKQYLGKEALPKSFSRVINASEIREAWKAKKRKIEEDGNVLHAETKRRKPNDDNKRRQTEVGRAKEKQMASHFRIKPGESIQHFNRRVEDDMRPLVKAAMKSSHSVARNTRKAELDAKAAKKLQQKSADVRTTVDKNEKAKLPRKAAPPSPPPVTQVRTGPHKEFAENSSSAPRRLNDIAQAPPEFKKLPRGAAAPKGGIGSGKREGVLSMAQKSMMEQEREKAIARYRELKARQRDGRDGVGEKAS